MENDYAFECKEQFIEYSYGGWNITLSDEIDYIGISIRHKRASVGKDIASPIYDEQVSMNVAERWVMIITRYIAHHQTVISLKI